MSTIHSSDKTGTHFFFINPISILVSLSNSCPLSSISRTTVTMVVTFLNLPREIRDRIYTLALNHQQITTYRHANGTHSFFRYPESVKFSLSLLSTNHQIHHEASAVFNPCTLHLVSLDALPHQPLTARKVQHLELHFEYSFNKCEFVKSLKFLREWPNLKSICLNAGGREPLTPKLQESVLEICDELEELGVTQAWYTSDVGTLKEFSESEKLYGLLADTGVFLKVDLEAEVAREHYWKARMEIGPRSEAELRREYCRNAYVRMEIGARRAFKRPAETSMPPWPAREWTGF